MRGTTIFPHNVTMITHFVHSQRLVVYVTVDGSVEGAQFCLSERWQLLGSSNVLLKHLLRFLLQLAHKHLPSIISPVGDKGPGEVRYHTAHQLVCKAACEVLLEGPRRWCRLPPTATPCVVSIVSSSSTRCRIDSNSAYTTNGDSSCFWILVNRHLASLGNLVLCV